MEELRVTARAVFAFPRLTSAAFSLFSSRSAFSCRPSASPPAMPMLRQDTVGLPMTAMTDLKLTMAMIMTKTRAQGSHWAIVTATIQRITPTTQRVAHLALFR